MIFPVAPVSKPRQTRSDKWKKRPCVLAYRAFADAMREHARVHGFAFPPAGAEIHFRVPMPSSWSRKKRERMQGQPHLTQPDIDNYIKAVLDSLLPDNDSGVWHLGAVSKTWVDGDGYIEIIDVHGGESGLGGSSPGFRP